MLNNIESLKNLEKLRNDVKLLEAKAEIFSGIDRVRYEELVQEIKALDMKILDLMVLEATLERFEAFVD